MKNIDRYIVLNGTYVALTKDNILVGYVIPEHMLPRPSRKRVDEFKMVVR